MNKRFIKELGNLFIKEKKVKIINIKTRSEISKNNDQRGRSKIRHESHVSLGVWAIGVWKCREEHKWGARALNVGPIRIGKKHKG